MKKILSLLFVYFLVGCFSSANAFAGKTYAVTGVVGSIDRGFAKIKVAGKSYRLARTLTIHETDRRGEIEPTVDEGDEVGLVFVGSSSKSGVQEIWLLSEGKK